MAFTKRKKQYHLYRGENPDPTEEELRNGVGTHIGREAHPTPDPTPYQKHIAATSLEVVKTERARVGAVSKRRKAKTKH